MTRGGNEVQAAPESFCEFGDGPFQAIHREPFPGDDPLVAPPRIWINIGSTEDCGGPEPDPGDNDVTQIVVPSGFYNVHATFGFGGPGVTLPPLPTTAPVGRLSAAKGRRTKKGRRKPPLSSVKR